MNDDIITQLLQYGREIGFRETVEMYEIRRLPRQLRRAAKLIKKDVS